MISLSNAFTSLANFLRFHIYKKRKMFSLLYFAKYGKFQMEMTLHVSGAPKEIFMLRIKDFIPLEDTPNDLNLF